MRPRNSRSRRVSAEWREPSRITLPEILADQREPPQDEGAHEDLAQFGVLGDQRTQAVRTDFEKFTGLGDAAAHQAARAGDHGHLTGKLAGGIDASTIGRSPSTVGLHDFHGTGKQDEERDRWYRSAQREFRPARTLRSLPMGRMRLICASVKVGKAWVLGSRMLGAGHVDMCFPRAKLADLMREYRCCGDGFGCRAAWLSAFGFGLSQLSLSARFRVEGLCLVRGRDRSADRRRTLDRRHRRRRSRELPSRLRRASAATAKAMAMR